MIKTINFQDFCDAFASMDRKDKFTYEGKQVLFDYLEQLGEDTGEPIELDVIALCCDYTEYKTAWEAMEQYKLEDMPTVDPEDTDGTGKDLVQIQEESEKLALEWLHDNTHVIEFDGSIIIQNF